MHFSLKQKVELRRRRPAVRNGGVPLYHTPNEEALDQNSEQCGASRRETTLNSQLGHISSYLQLCLAVRMYKKVYML